MRPYHFAGCLGLLVALPSLAAAGQPDHLLFQAVRRGDADLLASLLRQGTPADLRAQDGMTPLAYAALWGTPRMVQSLLDSGADPNATDDHGATPLLYGAGDIDKVKRLLRAGADPNSPSKLGNTPLIVAAAHPQSTSIVELLLGKGAQLSVANNRGISALRNAVIVGDLKTVKLLLNYGASVDAPGNSTSNLSIAAERGHIEIVRLLLKHGADVNTSGGRHSLHNALLAQKPAIAQLLLDSGARLDRRLSPGDVPSFVLAAYNEVGDTSVAREMIELETDLNVANEFDETAVAWARKRGHQELIELLLDAGAADEQTNEDNGPIPQAEIEWTEENWQPLLAEAITKSIALLQHSSDVFLEKRETCVSCHHQNLPSVAIGWARDRGFQADDPSIERMIEAQQRSWRPRIQRAYEMDRPVPVEPRFIGYGLLGFAALGCPPDEASDAMVWYLANIQQPDGSWTAGMQRPPLGGGAIVATVLAMRSLQLYPPEARRVEFAQRIVRARDWLQRAEPRTHQERAIRLLGLGWAGVPPTDLVDAVAELVAEQRDDGGWAQLPGLTSDAWATGQSVVALHVAGGLPGNHPACLNGNEFLVRTQFEDGSWYVRHRTWPFQAHFNSEFPHGRDQWVSAAATAWATMALTLSAEPQTFADSATTTSASPPTPRNQKAVAPVDSGPADFTQEIQPILVKSCVGCHSGEAPKGGLRLTNRKALLDGGDSGEPVIVPGDGGDGLLVRYVSDSVEDFEMPPLGKRDKYPALTSRQQKRLRAWIEQGAKWPSDVVLRRDE